jgi:hypothetical protein
MLFFSFHFWFSFILKLQSPKANRKTHPHSYATTAPVQLSVTDTFKRICKEQAGNEKEGDPGWALPLLNVHHQAVHEKGPFSKIIDELA